MSSLQNRLAKLSPEQRAVLEKKILQSDKYTVDLPKDSNEEKLSNYYKTLGANSETAKDYVRFAPFPQMIPGFSWIEIMLEPGKSPEHNELNLRYQEEMKRVLFRGIDFSSIDKVMDIGCGYSYDLIDLAQKHPHLQLNGYNISSEQVRIGKEKTDSLGYSQRINIYNRDSAKQPFPDEYNLIYSCQVIHHIKKKEKVFLNISKHLSNGGFFVAAEIISNLPLTPIEDVKSTAYFETRTKWAELLAQNNLRVVEAVDASFEIGNYLKDANFTENFTRLTQNYYDEVAKEHLKGLHELGELLRKKLAIYMLVTVQKDSFIEEETILRLNQEKLSNLVPYARMIEARSDGKIPLLPQLSREESSVVRQKANNFREQFASQQPSQILDWLKSYLKIQVANILKISQAQVEVETSLNLMGFDSIMFFELQKSILDDLGIDIKISDVMKSITIINLARKFSELASQMNSDSEEKEGFINIDSQQTTTIEGTL